ncbi:hypothetical protein ACQKDS_06945 [Serratia sp. NPDC078593]|uniref:hypothetical protein n=1 Tax=unclassified Serratia (in: enterobacteria) TaxID=2647522 RepID=UPI0037D95CD0
MQFKTAIAVFLFFVSSFCWGGRWPALSDLMILSCKNTTCDRGVEYLPGPVVFTDIASSYVSQALTTEIIPYGIHCLYGSLDSFFAQCKWYNDTAHKPQLLGKCQTTTAEGWELTPDSGCEVSANSYGVHNGAKPGGECVVFGKRQAASESFILSIDTPWGFLSADTVANSGRTYCIKAESPPSLQCNIDTTSAIIDHGTITNNSVDERQITANLRCGVNPTVRVFGPSTIKLGEGVTSEITVTRVNDTQANIVSTLRTVNAEAGDYQGSFVVVISPN